MWMWKGCHWVEALRITHSSVVLRRTTWSSRLASKMRLLIWAVTARGLIGGLVGKVIRRRPSIAAVERSSTGNSVVGSGCGAVAAPADTRVARTVPAWVVNPVAIG